MTIHYTLRTTNWELLAEQKELLVKMLDAADDYRQFPLYSGRETLEGLLNWIDAIQDAAHDDGYPVVFLTEGNTEAAAHDSD